jgi:NAD(P)-dependent dehydrogenase (short-subunit alcohol dehydrogenase family)
MSETKIALVTGAGSGIGRGCALASIGGRLEGGFRGPQMSTLNAAIESAGSDGQRGSAVTCNVTQEDAVTALFAQIRERFGRLDLLFNNAGTSGKSALPDEMPYSAWRHTVDTNLNGTFYCLSEAFRLMREQSPRGGRIINNGSISAHVPRPRSIAYAATKHAITGLTKAANLDGRPFDIAVGQIDIGNAQSDMTANMARGVPQADGSSKPEALMDLSAVTDTFMAMVNLPLSANVLFMTVMATRMPYVGRG